jgi:hypothetical protein
LRPKGTQKTRLLGSLAAKAAWLKPPSQSPLAVFKVKNRLSGDSLKFLYAKRGELPGEKAREGRAYSQRNRLGGRLRLNVCP